MSDELEIFPLHIVLFPGSFVPLHIFEERYKRLIDRCRDGHRAFGINFVEQTQMAAVGCTARVVEILKTYDDGRLDIIVAGNRRYTLQSIQEIPEECITAQVEYFDDDPDAFFNPSLFEECIALFNDIVNLVYTNAEELNLQYTPGPQPTFSYIMAQKVGLPLAQKQLLLESRSEHERLGILQQHMERLLPTLRKPENLQSVLRLDGYLRKPDSKL